MTSGSGSFFVDANVLVYAAVQDDPRHGVAKALLEDSTRGTIYVSAQIVTEFFSTITNAKRLRLRSRQLKRLNLSKPCSPTSTFPFLLFPPMFQSAWSHC